MPNSVRASDRNLAAVPNFIRHKKRPGTYLVQQFIDHIRRTGEPETLSGLYLGPIEKTEPFEILATFEVERQKRGDGKMAFCPMCSQPNKFIKGALIYLPRLQAVSAIGHECAHLETRAAAVKEFRSRRQKEFEENYLIENLPLIAKKVEALGAAMHFAKEAQKIHHALRKDAKSAIQQLRQAKEKGGLLTVVEKLDAKLIALGASGLKGSGGVQTRDILMGTLSGGVAVIKDYTPVADLIRIGNTLAHFRKVTTQDDALELVCDLPDKDRHDATTLLREADDRYTKFVKRLSDFCAFFSEANLSAIRRWTAHPAHPRPFKIAWTSAKGKIDLSIWSFEDHCKVQIPTSLFKPPPTWPVTLTE